MTPIQRERCERAIAFGRSFVPPEGAKFNMRIWGTHPSGHKPREQNYCGTSACFAGWLSLDPWFRKQGMAGQWQRSVVTGYAWRLAPCGVEYGTGTYPFYALKDFFGLSEAQIFHVFGPDKGGTAVDAADRLQACLDGAVT